jgi:two-component system sensor histidine kinase/response regulator
LRRFMANYRDFARDIAEFLDSGDHASAERFAHTLKGVAGNIGATRIMDLAADLEAALRDGSPRDETRAHVAMVSDALKHLIDALQVRLDTGADAGAIAERAPFAFSALNQLKSLVAASDAEALDLLSEHRLFLRKIFDQDFGKLEQAIAEFDFERALAIIEDRQQPPA